MSEEERERLAVEVAARAVDQLRDEIHRHDSRSALNGGKRWLDKILSGLIGWGIPAVMAGIIFVVTQIYELRRDFDVRNAIIDAGLASNGDRISRLRTEYLETERLLQAHHRQGIRQAHPEAHQER